MLGLHCGWHTTAQVNTYKIKINTQCSLNCWCIMLVFLRAHGRSTHSDPCKTIWISIMVSIITRERQLYSTLYNCTSAIATHVQQKYQNIQWNFSSVYAQHAPITIFPWYGKIYNTNTIWRQDNYLSMSVICKHANISWEWQTFTATCAGDKQ